MAEPDAVFRGLDRYISSVRNEFEDLLGQMVEVPTISMEPDRKPDIERGAQLAASYLTGIGAGAEVVSTQGYPVVIGRLEQNPAYPTVSIYNHLDVQPADPTEWKRPPFTFFKQDGRYEGRGTTDDKGPAMTAMLAARYAAQQGVPININFIWELEEEIGSPSFDRFVKLNLPRLKTDSVLVSDTIWIARGKPAIPYGLRGLQAVTFTLQTGAKDVHSGLTGGAARNPIGELAQVVSECYDARTGRVKIPGFYKDVVPATAKEVKSFIDSGFTVASFMKAHELKSVRVKDAKRILKAVMSEPTFEVHGITGGYSGPGVKTIVPFRAEAKISMRMVPRMDPAKIVRLVRDFVRKRNPDVKVNTYGTLKPYLGQFSGPYADAGRLAMRFAFGKDPAFTREGGSIGAVVTMQKYLRVPITFLGLSLPEHGYHAINENFDWCQASGGIKMFVKYFSEIAKLKSA
ncbi:MAG: M20/M25/M40 family metallo-hydrolase [Acidobacteria bacterium]|nr:M20/M25/M40 family metallo-hydrolase [Acidobacteriota bacterium]